MRSSRRRSFADLIRGMRRHKLAVVLTSLVIPISSAVAMKATPVEYVSSALVEAESAGDDLSRSYEPDKEHIQDGVRRRVTSRSQVQALIDKNDLHSEAGGSDDLIAEVRNRIGVTWRRIDGDKNVLAVSYRSANPDNARTATADLVDQLIQGSSAVKSETPAGIEILRKQTIELASKLREIEREAPWLLIGKETGQPAVSNSAARTYQPSAEALRLQQMNVESLKDQQYKLEQQIGDVDKRIAAQRQIVDAQKKTTTLAGNPTYALLVTKRAELQGQRDNLINRQELTDKHPRVLALTDQITAINNQIDELRKQEAGGLSQTPETRELLNLESDRKRLQLDKEFIGREISRRTAAPVVQNQTPGSNAYRAAQLSPLSGRFAREYQDLKQEYAAKMERLEEVRDEAPGQIERFRIVEPAGAPRIIGQPNLPLFLSLSVVIGLTFGVCLAFALDSRRRKTVQDEGDIEYYTRLPLLVAIPKTISPVENRRLKSRSLALTTAGITVATVATLALAKLMIVADVFTRIASR